MPWNVEQLRDLVAVRYGADRAELCWRSLQSIHDRQQFAGYHFREFKRLITSRFPPDRTLVQELDLLYRLQDDAWTNHVLEFEASAHVAACLHSIQCVSDTLGLVIYTALGPQIPELEKLGERYSYLSKVRSALQRTRRYPKLSASLEKLCDAEDFVYLNDVVNHSKHRRLISLQPIVKPSQTGDLIELELTLPPFEHDGKLYQSRDVNAFLNGEYGRQSHLVVEVGEQLNTALT